MALDIKEDKDLNYKFAEIFSKNKKNIILLILIFVFGYFAANYYVSSVKKGEFIASDLYQKIQLSKDLPELEVLVNKLIKEYSGSSYTARSSIYIANVYQKNEKYLKAKDSYIWASKNSREPTIRSLANYQLACMLYVQKDYDLALNAALNIDDNGFKGLKNNLLGDVYFAQGKNSEALHHFNVAYDFFNNKSDLAKVIKLKIDAIGKI